MAFPVVIPNTFANATASIPLSQLDNNFSTVVIAVNGIANGAESLSNVSITGGTIDNVAIGGSTSSTGVFTTVNKVTITQPATAANLTLADNSTLATSGAHSVTLTSTGTTNVTLPTSGTLATTGGTVASISFGSTGLTPSTATTGAVSVAGTLAVANGGTGITSFGTGVATALGQNVTGSGGIALASGPTFTTPTLGVASATSINKVAITAPATSATLTIADGKTLTANNSLTLAGTDGTTMTFPTTSASVARTDAAQTFAGTQTFDVVVANYLYATNVSSVGSFTWNTATSSPSAAVTAVGSRVVTSVHAGMRRCVINDSGVVQYFLSATDSTKKADGSNANLDGTDGQVMVQIPKFYTKREVSGTYITWSISAVPIPGFAVHPAFIKDGSEVDFRYYSAYDACVFDVSASTYISGQNYDNNSGANGVQVDVTASTGDKLASVSGIYPMVGLTRAEFRTIAANRGSGWRQLDWTLFAAVQLLYLVEYQTFFSQNVLGNGNTGTTYATTASDPTQAGNGGSEAGKSNALGNASTDTTSGASSASRGVAYMSYRGIENFYGNEWNWADGVIVNPDGSVSADQGDWWFTNNSADFSDSVRTNMTQITTAGATGSGVWMTALANANNFFVPAASTGGSSSTYITDQYFNSTSADRVVLVSGAANDGADAGAFVVFAAFDSSYRTRAVGARLAF